MATYLVIVFTDGSKIALGQYWHGSECFLSQYKFAKKEI